MSVLILRPNNDSTQTLSRSTGTNNYALVDEETKDESDYVWNDYDFSEIAMEDIYGFPDHSSESGTINSVTVKAYCKYVLSGTCTRNATFNPSVKIGSTTYYGGAQNLTSSTALYSYAWTTNPATSSAWGSDWSVIDSLLSGQKLGSGWSSKGNARRPYSYQLWVEVDYTEGGGSTVFLPNIMKHNFIPPLIGGY